MSQVSQEKPVRVIVGLGNPGDDYAQTRHNVGFLIVDSLVAKLGWKWKRSLRFRGHWCKGVWEGEEMYFLKPNTFMNASGRSLQLILKYFKLTASQLVCVYDDITLPFGRLKLSIGGGDAGHNGIKDIHRMIGNEFVRFRIGIGQKTKSEMDLKDYVLSRFSDEELAHFSEQVVFYGNSIALIKEKGAILAMNTINQNKPNL